MPGINPISGGVPPIGSSQAGRPSMRKPPAGKPNFADALSKYVGKIDQDQRSAAGVIQDAVAGKTDDVLPVVSAVAKADLSFKLLVGVRNKVIEAYRQTMNMQI